MGSETSTPRSGEEYHHFHRPVWSFLFLHSTQMLLNKCCEDGEVVLERCDQVPLAYMSVCRFFFLSDRRNILVRWEQINVGDLSQRMSPAPTRR